MNILNIHILKPSSQQHRSSTLELDIPVNGSYYLVRFQTRKNLQLAAASTPAAHMWNRAAESNNPNFENWVKGTMFPVISFKFDVYSLHSSG